MRTVLLCLLLCSGVGAAERNFIDLRQGGEVWILAGPSLYRMSATPGGEVKWERFGGISVVQSSQPGPSITGTLIGTGEPIRQVASAITESSPAPIQQGPSDRAKLIAEQITKLVPDSIELRMSVRSELAVFYSLLLTKMREGELDNATAVATFASDEVNPVLQATGRARSWLAWFKWLGEEKVKNGVNDIPKCIEWYTDVRDALLLE